jgi:anti-sigma factor RsiW
MAMMTMTNDPAFDRDELEMLLPWYAAGTLSRADAARVNAALAQDEELARRYRMVREELDETVAVNERLGAPSAGSMERLFAQIETERGKRRKVGDFASRIAGLLAAMSPRALAWSAAAAALLILIQAGLLAVLYLGAQPGPQSYQTASFGEAGPRGEGRFALVRFNSTATAAEIARVLVDHKASIVDGPRANGLYRIRLGDGALSQDAAAKIMGRMQEEKGVISLVAPAD